MVVLTGRISRMKSPYSIYLKEREREREKRKTFVFFTAKQTLMVTSLTLLAVFWTREQTLAVSAAQHKTFPVDISEPFYTHTASFVLSFPQTSVMWFFWGGGIYFGNFMLPMYSSQVFVQLTCKGDDTYAEACSDNSKEKVMFHFDWDISQKDMKHATNWFWNKYLNHLFYGM